MPILNKIVFSLLRFDKHTPLIIYRKSIIDRILKNYFLLTNYC